MKKMYKQPIVETCETDALMDTVGVSTVSGTGYSGPGGAPARVSFKPIPRATL